jgi:DNA-binding NarL/FixJ family response regulator
VEQVRVLIVDDQLPFRRAAAAVVDLTDPFVVVGMAESAEDCLAVISDLRPDLVLMDLALPGMNGLEAAHELSALPKPPVVVLVSTHEEEEFGGSVRACGAVDYIPKSSFGPEPLQAAWALRSSGSTATKPSTPCGE